MYVLLIYPSRFRDRRYVKQSAPNDATMTLNSKKSKPRHTCYWCPRVPNITTYCSTTSHFRVKGYFETSEPNAIQGQMYPLISVASVPEFQISLCSLNDSKSKSDDPKLTQNHPEDYTMSTLPHNYVCYLRPKFHSISLFGQLFWVRGNFERSQMYLRYSSVVSPSSKL